VYPAATLQVHITPENEYVRSGEAQFGNENNLRSSPSSNNDGSIVPIGRPLRNLSSSIEQLTSTVSILNLDMNILHYDITDLRTTFTHLKKRHQSFT
jgi:hypothetical protein